MQNFMNWSVVAGEASHTHRKEDLKKDFEEAISEGKLFKFVNELLINVP